jgi:hypothetical protein
MAKVKANVAQEVDTIKAEVESVDTVVTKTDKIRTIN